METIELIVMGAVMFVMTFGAFMVGYYQGLREGTQDATFRLDIQHKEMMRRKHRDCES